MRVKVGFREREQRLPDAAYPCDGCAAVERHGQIHRTEAVALMGFPLGLAADHVELTCQRCARRSSRDATASDPAPAPLDRFGLLVVGTAIALFGLVMNGPEHWRDLKRAREESAAAKAFLSSYDDRAEIAGKLFDSCVSSTGDTASSSPEESELSTPKYRVRVVRVDSSRQPLFTRAALFCVRFFGAHTAQDVREMRVRVGGKGKEGMIVLAEDRVLTAWAIPQSLSSELPPAMTGTVPREQWLSTSLDDKAQREFWHMESSGYTKGRAR